MTGVRARLRVEHPEFYCPACGHLWRSHQNVGMPTSRLALDAPVPCCAARARGTGPDGRLEYDHCGCRALLDDPELAREVVRGQSA